MKLTVTLLIIAAGALLMAAAVPAPATAEHATATLSTNGGPPFPATLEAIQDNVFTPGCALSFCHGVSTQANLNLEEGNSWSNLVDVPSFEVPTMDRVKPFDPDASYLICKLENCPATIGEQMPIIGGPLDQSVIDVIRQWISDGAPDNPPISVEETTFGRVKAFYR